MKTSEEIKKGLKNAKHVQCMEIASDNENGGTCYGVLVGYVLRDKIFAYIQQLESRLAQVERERDAAIADCSRFPCATCSDKTNGDLCHNCNVRKDTTRTNYEWRGVCAENTEEEGK